jgi:hypothetical protein
LEDSEALEGWKKRTDLLGDLFLFSHDDDLSCGIYMVIVVLMAGFSRVVVVAESFVDDGGEGGSLHCLECVVA